MERARGGRKFHCEWILLALALSLAGCLSDSPQARMLGLVQGDLLPVAHPWARARLAVEAEGDPALARWLAAHGAPDYLLVESSQRLRLFYVASDSVVVCEHAGALPSACEAADHIGALYHERFSNADRSALAALRFARAGLAMDPTWKGRPRAAGADAVAEAVDPLGLQPWAPGRRAARLAPQAPSEAADEDVAFRAESGPPLAAFRATSRSAVLTAGSLAKEPRRRAVPVATAASLRDAVASGSPPLRPRGRGER